MDIDFDKNILLKAVGQILMELGHDVWMLKYLRIFPCPKKMFRGSYLKEYMVGYEDWTFNLIVLLLSFEKNIVLKPVGPILTEVHTIVRTSRVVGEGISKTRH